MNHGVFNVAVQSQSKRLRWGRIMRVCYLKTGAMTTEDHCRWGKFVVLFLRVGDRDRKAEGCYDVHDINSRMWGWALHFQCKYKKCLFNSQNTTWLQTWHSHCLAWFGILARPQLSELDLRYQTKRHQVSRKTVVKSLEMRHECQTNRGNSLMQ